MNLKCKFCNSELIRFNNSINITNTIYITKCTSCDLTQLNDFSHIKENYYTDQIFSDDFFKNELIKYKEWNKSRLDYFLKFIPNIKDKKILDYGCGVGGFLEVAQNELNIIGYDINKSVCKLNVNNNLKCHDSLEQTYDADVIFLSHVLEHLKEPWRFLEEIKNQYKNTEYFVIEVPNDNECLKTIYKNNLYIKNSYHTEHLFYFNTESLKHVVESANMEIIVNTQLQRYSLANHLGWLIKGKGGYQNIYKIFNNKFINKFYAKLLIYKGVADSIFFICKKLT